MGFEDVCGLSATGARHGRHALRRILPARRVRRAQLRPGRVQRRGHQYEGQEYLEGPLRAAGCPALPGAAPFGLLLPGRIRRLLPAARPLRSGRLLRPRSGRPARRVDRRRDGTSGRGRTPGGRPPGEQRLVCAGRLARHADADARRALRHFPREYLRAVLPPDQLHGRHPLAAGEVPALPARLHLRGLRFARCLEPQRRRGHVFRNLFKVLAI